jgi:hypothetical protein
MLLSLSAGHGTPGFGALWSSHIAIPNQNAGWSWKFQVEPLPSWLGGAAGSVGRVSRYRFELPEPALFE